MIEFKNVSFRYGSRVILDQVSFTAEPGQCTVLAGPNGIGKSTAIALAAGALKCDSGEVKCSGSLGYAPQEVALFSDLSVEDNLKFFANLRGVAVPKETFLPLDRSRGNAENRSGSSSSPGTTSLGTSSTSGTEPSGEVSSLKAKILGFFHPVKKVENLSGGMQKRVSLVCADLGSPEVLLLDEPCIGLDIAAQKILFQQIEKWKLEGRCILYAGHNAAEIATICDRLVLLRRHEHKVLERAEISSFEEVLQDWIEGSELTE